MVSAINFAVRTVAGATQLGTVAGEGQSNLIAVQPGQSVSLNLSPGSVVAYTQQGNDLLVQLMDGRTIVLSGYFVNAGGAANKLYLSSYDELIEVRVAGGVDGVLFADYGPMQAMEKWSPLDGLRFSQSDVLDDALVASNEPAGMAGLVPGLLAGGGAAAGLGGLGTAAAVAGGAVLLGGGGGGTGGGGNTGGGTGGTGGGGAGGGGTGGGGTGGGGTGGGGSGGGGTGGGGTGGVHTPPSVNQSPSTPVTTNSSNPAVVVTGGGHPGDTVLVTVGGQTGTATIGGNGRWTVTFTGPTLPPDGTYVPAVVVTNTVTGGTTNLTAPTVIIDMTPPVFVVQDGTTGTNDIHNIAAYAQTNGRTVISGTGEVGATVTVVANGHTVQAVVQPNGIWTVSFTQAQIPGGEFRTVPVSIFSTDVHGNVSATQTSSIAIDTVANPITQVLVAGADNTVNLIESQGGFTITGFSLPRAQLTLTIGTHSTTVTAGADGSWSAFFGGGLVTQNGAANVQISTVDGAQNLNVQNVSFMVDTVASASISSAASQGFAGSINAAEAAAGVNITGRADAGSSLVINFEGQNRTATADANGNWTANFSLAHLIGANAVERLAQVSVTATDPHGNTASSTIQFTIDTRAPNDPRITGDVGDTQFISGVLIDAAPATQQYFAVADTGAAQQLTASRLFADDANGDPVFAGQVNFSVNVPNGTYLVVRDTDAAGNESSTLHLRAANEVTVDLARAGLQQFDFGTINLSSADANLTLDAARILALTGADRQMTITGDIDDTVTLRGAQDTQTNVSAHGETYRLYTLGSGASVLIDDDILVNLTS